MKHPLIAVTGGIGSGKSVVSRVLRAMGFDVYDCDSEAKRLMDSDTEIHSRLNSEIDPRIVVGGIIDRPLLASLVFGHPQSLATLNAIVHSAVREHLAHWRDTRSGIAFVETAIMYESGLNAMVDAEWRVTSPLDLRIERTMKRSGLTRRQVEDRISSQNSTETPPRPPLTIITNDERSAILPQIRAALSDLYRDVNGK